MKKYQYLLIGLGLFLYQACNQAKDNESQKRTMENMDHNKMEHKEGHEHHQMVPSSQPSGMSLYNVDSEWTTQENEKIKLNALQGKIQVVSMIYASCQYACPRIIADMQKIKKGVPADMADQVNYVLISIDPERDTPERLRQFTEEKNMDAKDWLLLNGKSGDVREMAALLGINYKRVGETDFNHSNIISVLNQKGEIVYQQKGLGQDPSASINKIKTLLSQI